MKWLGTKRILIKSIALPGNFAATRAAPRITELATLVRRTDGPIHHPVVEAATKKLLAGHDRIAALLALKEKHVEVRLWEGTPQEFREIQVIENLGRRADDPNALTAELVRIEAGIVRDEAIESGDPEPSEQTVKGEARKRVASAKGVTPDAIKTAEKRAASKGGSQEPPARRVNPAKSDTSGSTDGVNSELTEEEKDAGGKVDLPDSFNTFGLVVPLASRSAILETIGQLSDWDKQLQELLRQLTFIEKRGVFVIAGVHIDRIREQVRNAGHAVRDAIPASLCFYCKAQPSSTPNCPACGGTGVVGRHGGDNVPPELKLGGDKARVAVDGKFVLVGAAANAAMATDPMVSVKNVLGGQVTVSKKFAEAAEKAVAKRRGVRVVAVDETGAEIDVPLPEDDGEELAF